MSLSAKSATLDSRLVPYPASARWRIISLMSCSVSSGTPVDVASMALLEYVTHPPSDITTEEVWNIQITSAATSLESSRPFSRLISLCPADPMLLLLALPVTPFSFFPFFLGDYCVVAVIVFLLLVALAHPKLAFRRWVDVRVVCRGRGCPPLAAVCQQEEMWLLRMAPHRL